VGEGGKVERVWTRRHPDGDCVGLGCAALGVGFAGAGAAASVHEACECRERGEGLQRGLHCLSWGGWQRRAEREHGVFAAGYLSGFYGLRGDDAGAGRQLEGGDRAWGALARAVADHAGVRGSAE
jgi:hypothetical protein